MHDISVVEVDGESSGADNPCLAAEAAWAGAGLNLYTFLTNEQAAPLMHDPTDCFNVGYNAGIHAFDDAQAAGVNTAVRLVARCRGGRPVLDLDHGRQRPDRHGRHRPRLHNTEGIADVGIYASPGRVEQIVGNYQPSVPYWMADWLSPAERARDLQRRRHPASR